MAIFVSLYLTPQLSRICYIFDFGFYSCCSITFIVLGMELLYSRIFVHIERIKIQ